MNANLPLLAAGDAMGAVIVILIMVASGIINFVKERRAEAKRKQELEEASGNVANQQLRGEIDKFLTEVEAANRGQSPRYKEAAIELTDADVIDSRPARKKAEVRRVEPVEEKRQAVSERHLKDAKVSRVGQRHVASQVRDHHLQSQVQSSHLSPEKDLGTGGVSTANGPGLYDNPHPLASLLSDAEGIRNAIVFNELLGPPVSRRKGSR